MNAIETERLTKKYAGRAAVDDVGLTVREGEIYGFLGPNGAGKTTTLRMVLGLVRPTSGTVRVLGRRPGDPRSANRIGALIEGPGFYPYLSGRDNLRTVARYRGLAAGAVDDALERVELTDRADDKFKAYSLGMKQRIGVACALLGSPQLIVLDEPTNGLDPSGMADMRALISGLAADGHTVILSSHLLGEVQEICDRVGVIDRGRLLRESTVAELRGEAELKLRATPLDDALAVAMRIAGDDAVRIVDDRLVLPSSVSTARLITALVQAGVDVHEAVSSERSLEDVFFEMTTNHEQSDDHHQPQTHNENQDKNHNHTDVHNRTTTDKETVQ